MIAWYSRARSSFRFAMSCSRVIAVLELVLVDDAAMVLNPLRDRNGRANSPDDRADALPLALPSTPSRPRTRASTRRGDLELPPLLRDLREQGLLRVGELLDPLGHQHVFQRLQVHLGV